MKLAQETLTYAENLSRDLYDVEGLVTIMQRNVKVWSWGARHWTNHKNRIIAFIVSGRKFKGNVAIMCNGSDLMDIHFCNNRGRLKDRIENIYIGNLIDTIDNYVENTVQYAD